MTPVLISCEPPSLKKGQAWYSHPGCKLEFSLEVGPSFRAEDWLEDAGLPAGIAARQLTEKLRAYFEARIPDEEH